MKEIGILEGKNLELSREWRTILLIYLTEIKKYFFSAIQRQHLPDLGYRWAEVKYLTRGFQIVCAFHSERCHQVTKECYTCLIVLWCTTVSLWFSVVIRTFTYECFTCFTVLGTCERQCTEISYWHEHYRIKRRKYFNRRWHTQNQACLHYWAIGPWPLDLTSGPPSFTIHWPRLTTDVLGSILGND